MDNIDYKLKENNNFLRIIKISNDHPVKASNSADNAILMKSAAKTPGSEKVGFWFDE